jgi:hypothetical protein
MNKQDDIFDKSGADSVSDDAIRRSLLGCADPGEQADFEELLMIDDQFAKRVNRLECELADDFTFGRLGPREHQLFTSHFLVTRDRAEKLAVSHALRQVVADHSDSRAGQTGLSWRSSVLNFFAFDSPYARATLAVSALFFFGLLAWVLLKAPADRPRLITKQQPVNSGEERAHAVGSRSPNQKSAVENSSTQPQVVARVTVQPDSKSQTKPAVQLSNSTNDSDLVRLELLIDGAAAATYQAILRAEGGADVTSSSELVAEVGNQTKVVMEVSASLLPSGNYYVELKRTSEGHADAMRYSFQVKKD